jgi:hypothetical protein
MATSAELKAQFNSAIRTKVAVDSISPAIVATQLDALADYAQGNRQILLDAATITLNVANGKNAFVTLGGNRTFAFTNLIAGDAGIIEIKQDGTGSRTATWPGNAILPGAGLGLSTGANELTAIGYYFNGTSILLSKENYGSIAADTTAPLVSSMTATSATNIRVVFNEAMQAASLTGWSFANGATVTPSSVTAFNSNTWDFTVAGLASGQTITGSYSGTSAKDVAGNNLAGFTGVSVTNSVSGGSLIDITFGTNVGPMNNSSGIWSAGNTTVGGYNLNKGIDAKKLASGQNGYVQMQYVSGGNCILGFNTANSNDNPSTYEAAAYLEGAALYKIDNGSISSLAVTMTAGHYVRVNRSGSVIKIQTSPDGSSWSDVNTLSFSSTADLYICGALDSNSFARMHYPKGFNIS